MKYEVEILFDYAEWALCPYNEIQRVYLKQDLSCSDIMYISKDGQPISSLVLKIGDGLRKLEDWQKNICDHFEKENKENVFYMLKDGHIMVVAKDGSRTIIPKAASEHYTQPVKTGTYMMVNEQSEINLNDIYNLTCILLKYGANKEVWVCNEVMESFTPVIDKAIKGGAKMYINEQETKSAEKTIIVGGFTFIEKPDIKGIMCFSSKSEAINEKDLSIEELLSVN